MFHLDVQVPRLNAREKLSSRHVLGVTDIRGDHNCPEKIRGHWKWITEWWMGSLCPDKNRPMQMVNAIRATCPGSAVPFLLRQVREEGFQSSPVPWKWLNYFSHYSKCLQLFISETEGLRGTFLSSWEHVSKEHCWVESYKRHKDGERLTVTWDGPLPARGLSGRTFAPGRTFENRLLFAFDLRRRRNFWLTCNHPSAQKLCPAVHRRCRKVRHWRNKIMLGQYWRNIWTYNT